MTLTIDELIKQILSQYDDLPTDEQRERIDRRVFLPKEDRKDEQG